MRGNRNLLFGVALLVPLVVLSVWFMSSGANRCSLYRNLGYVNLAKGTVARSRAPLRTAAWWFSASLLAKCSPGPATLGLGHAYAGLGLRSSAIAAWSREEEAPDGLREFLKGRAYEAMGRPADARREYRKLPRDAAAHFNGLAVQADRQGEFEQALRYFSVSYMINPASPKTYYGSAFVYWRRLGDEARAAAMVRRALAVDRRPSADRDFYRGLLCYYEEEIECALAAWASAVRYGPRDDDYFDPRYLAYEMLSRGLNEREEPETGPPAVAAPAPVGIASRWDSISNPFHGYRERGGWIRDDATRFGTRREE